MTNPDYTARKSREKVKEDAPPLITQTLDFLKKKYGTAEASQKNVGMFLTKAKETTVAGIQNDHAEGEFRTKILPEVLGYLSP